MSLRTARRSTGPTPARRNTVLLRAMGLCEVCGNQLHGGDEWRAVHSFHHRQARGMGGSSRPEVNSPANVLLVCGTGTTGCHGFIEAHRTAAELEGWLVRHGLDPATVPVTVHDAYDPTRATRRVLLDHHGDYQEVR